MFYVYLHVHHNTGYPVVFYVGKGQRQRAWSKDSRSKLWHHVSKKHGYEVVIHRAGLTEKEAFNFETQLIQQIGRRDLGTGPLVNLSDGGKGGKNGCRDSIERSAEGQRKSWKEKRELRCNSLKEAWKERRKRFQSSEHQKQVAREFGRKRFEDAEYRAQHAQKIKDAIARRKASLQGK